jgi:hypothetical protein
MHTSNPNDFGLGFISHSLNLLMKYRIEKKSNTKIYRKIDKCSFVNIKLCNNKKSSIQLSCCLFRMFHWINKKKRYFSILITVELTIHKNTVWIQHHIIWFCFNFNILFSVRFLRRSDSSPAQFEILVPFIKCLFSPSWSFELPHRKRKLE